MADPGALVGNDAGGSLASPGSRPLESLAKIFLIRLVVAGLAVAVYRDRHILARTFSELRLQTIALSTLLVVAGNVLTYASWRSLLTRIGIPLAWASGFRTFFTTQLGKYIPGSVWPAVMQTAAIGRRGGNRSAAVTANITAVVIGCVTGVGAAVLTLPFVSAGAMKRYWLTLALLPVLVCALHPRALSIGERAIRRISPQY
ncbi:MAG TPA: hypothetical protein VK816_00320 [Jatrophihabitantaceae bacterium]|jgi:hypothetical protein|nr:hypothetical protein [Jatrophihabitantaceae bacterium]